MKRLFRHVLTLCSTRRLLTIPAVALIALCQACASQSGRLSAAAAAVGSTGPSDVVEETPDAAKLRREAEAVVAEIRNDQFFAVLYPPEDGISDIYVGEFEPFPGSPCERGLYRMYHFNEARDALMRALENALDDPDRWAAAHLLLSKGAEIADLRGERRLCKATPVAGKSFGPKDCWRGPHDALPWVRTDYDGLTFTLNEWVPDKRDPVVGFNKDMDFHAVTGEADASQRASIREMWRRRVDEITSMTPEERVLKH